MVFFELFFRLKSSVFYAEYERAVKVMLLHCCLKSGNPTKLNLAMTKSIKTQIPLLQKSILHSVSVSTIVYTGPVLQVHTKQYYMLYKYVTFQ